MVGPRVTQWWVDKQDLLETSLSEGRAGLGSKAHADYLSPKSKEGHLCRKLSPSPVATVSLREFARFLHLCLGRGSGGFSPLGGEN